MNKTIRISLVFLFLLSWRFGFSQNEKSGYNESFWSGYADKLQLSPKDRLEFLNAHKRSASQLPVQQPAQPSTYNKSIVTNSILAGPCVNADFELGNLTGWTRSCGFNPGFNPLGCCPNPNGKQFIMSGAGTDPYGGFPVVLPGGNFSLKLGNDSVNGEADRIQQTFLVSPSNANFSYQYAVVLEDPNHPINQQPFFQVEMIDTLGNPVPCTNYYVAAGQNIPGFFNSPIAGVIYKPWTTVLVDLSPYIGQNITIRFSAVDCSLGGHFGYAYIDGVCQSFIGGGSAPVCASSNYTFCAPSGLASYTWNGPGVVNVVNQCVTATTAGIYTVSTTLFTGCVGPSFTYTLTNQIPSVANAGATSSICANNNVATLSGTVSGFSSTGQWSTSGTGTIASTTNLNTTYTASAADIAAGVVNFTLTSTANGICGPSTSTTAIIITPAPVVNAGTGQSICNTGTAVLNGNVSAGSTTGNWSSSGSGTFTPSSSALNASYIPSAADITAGSVTLTLTSANNGNCIAVSDTVIIGIKQLASVNAGANQTLCSNSGSISLAGTISGGTSTGSWLSSGSGGFNPNNTSLNTSYNITAADISSGSVTFTLNSTNNGPCPSVNDTVKVSIATLASVNAGTNQSICSTTSSVNLNGSVTGISVGSGIWASSGSGSFNPNNTTLIPSYNVTAADILAGSITFTLTSNSNGPCPAVSDTIKIGIAQLATVSAGPNSSLCSNTGSISLTGTINGSTTSGIWTASGSGAYSPGNTSMNTGYAMTAADISAGAVTFTLASTNNGPCPVVNDTVMVSITTIASVNAGFNQTICSTTPTINLNGTIGGTAGTGVWNGSGAGGYSPSSISLNPTYSVTPADITTGFVTFTLISTNNGPCPVVTDSVRVNIFTLASVNAGASTVVCSNSGTVALNGIINGSTNTGIWTTNGIGPFVPSPASLNNTYFIQPADISAGLLTFTLTSTNNGVCPATNDTMQLIITQLATSSAGPNQAICANTNSVNLNGTIFGGTTSGIWSSNGTGNFVPSNTNLNTTYTLSPADISSGSVTFSLTSTNNGACSSVTDTMKISIKPLAIVNAGPDQTICSTNTNVAFNGSVSVGSSTGMWSTNGAGFFSPNTTTLNTNYLTNAADVSTGTVSLILSSTNNGVCPAVVDTAKLIIIKKPVLNLKPDTVICAYGNSIVLTGSLSGGSGEILWTTSGTGYFTPKDYVNPVTYNFSQNDLSAGFAQVSLFSVNNGPCGNSAASININIKPVPNADFSASTYTAYIPNDPIQFTNQSTGAISYNWNFGDGNFSAITDPSHNYPEVGFYNVNLIATNEFGCKDTAVKTITIISDFQFPNVFTPNGDGMNDEFLPFTEGVTDYHLMIFNRWGELIFESNYVKNGWDGNFNGKPCQQDAYVWKAKVKFFDGRALDKTGSITILR